ncbi:MAG: hypothetical protein GF384_01835 [Elusimicrobia bacterium]|nr:hypothetical protein [Elusimicrobiota bacterium]MBD3411734.1 hypothetical protein [Elusimicrobiota bacterium]
MNIFYCNKTNFNLFRCLIAVSIIVAGLQAGMCMGRIPDGDEESVTPFTENVSEVTELRLERTSVQNNATETIVLTRSRASVQRSGSKASFSSKSIEYDSVSFDNLVNRILQSSLPEGKPSDELQIDLVLTDILGTELRVILPARLNGEVKKMYQNVMELRKQIIEQGTIE